MSVFELFVNYEIILAIVEGHSTDVASVLVLSEEGFPTMQEIFSY